MWGMLKATIAISAKTIHMAQTAHVGFAACTSCIITILIRVHLACNCGPNQVCDGQGNCIGCRAGWSDDSVKGACSVCLDYGYFDGADCQGQSCSDFACFAFTYRA